MEKLQMIQTLTRVAQSRISLEKWIPPFKVRKRLYTLNCLKSQDTYRPGNEASQAMEQQKLS